jgi:hypothetical protein
MMMHNDKHYKYYYHRRKLHRSIRVNTIDNMHAVYKHKLAAPESYAKQSLAFVAQLH